MIFRSVTFILSTEYNNIVEALPGYRYFILLIKFFGGSLKRRPNLHMRIHVQVSRGESVLFHLTRVFEKYLWLTSWRVLMTG